MTIRQKFPWWKLITGFVLYIIFHQSYDLLGGGTIGAILGEQFESIYSHMKMFFSSYLVVSAIDYFIRRRQIPSASRPSKGESPWMLPLIKRAIPLAGNCPF